jgi:hypothetical protein
MEREERNGEEGRGIKKTKSGGKKGGRQEFFYKVPGPRMAQSSIGKDRAPCRGNWATEPRLSSGGQVGIHKDFCGGKTLGRFRTEVVSVVTATRSHVKFALHRVMSQQPPSSPDLCRHNSHAQRDGPADGYHRTSTQLALSSALTAAVTPEGPPRDRLTPAWGYWLLRLASAGRRLRQVPVPAWKQLMQPSRILPPHPSQYHDLSYSALPVRVHRREMHPSSDSPRANRPLTSTVYSSPEYRQPAETPHPTTPEAKLPAHEQISHLRASL